MIKQENVPSFKLNAETVIPMLGLGSFEFIEDALGLGYRHFNISSLEDCFKISKAIKESEIPRENLFLAAKCGFDFEKYLQVLETDYLDLSIADENNLEYFSQLKRLGEIRAIGLWGVNFDKLNDILGKGFEINNLQIELHPSLNEKNLQEFCRVKNITVTACSPFGQGQDLNIQIIKEIAKKYSISSAQAILCWHLQEGRAVIAGPSEKNHLKENIESLNFKLSETDLEKIDSIG